MSKRRSNPEGVMSVSAHLKELRKRLLLSFTGILIGAVAGWYLYEPVMAYIQAPLTDMANAQLKLNFQTIGAAFDLKLRVALWVGVLLASPWWVYQIGAFIGPGLRKNEKIYLSAFGLVGILLFAAGAVSGMWVVPKAVEILTSFTPEDGVNLLQASTYVDFYMRLVLAFGASFLAPEILVALNFIGVLSWKRMVKMWRWAVILAFTFAAIANPLPSPWPMVLQACVLLALYLAAIGISALHEHVAAHGWRLHRRTPSTDIEPVKEDIQ